MIANFIGFSFGWSCSWANVNFLELQSPDSTLEDGPITYDQASLLMSLLCFGGLLGNVTYLWALAKFGRKRPILSLSVPTIVRTFNLNYVLAVLQNCDFCRDLRSAADPNFQTIGANEHIIE